MLISSSLIVDILGLYLLASGVFGNSVRPLLGLIILFSLRQLSQFITSLPTPPGMIWRDPGFPSLLVTYEVSNDLFFSGHTALAFFGATELMHTGNSYLAGLGILASLYQVAVMLALRAHWTMDIFAGGVTALWIAELVAQISPSIDLWLLGIL
jgi:xanthine/uracil permease